MGYEAVIFDLDGTLVYTKPEYRYLVVGQVLDGFGLSADKNDIDNFWFGSKREKIIKASFGLNPDDFWKSYKNHDTIELRKEYSYVYDDVVDVLKELKKNRIKTAIFTGAPFQIAALEIGMIGDYFDEIVISGDAIKKKPNPQGLLECMKILKVSNKKVIYVGNANEDILTAKKAKVLDVLLFRKEHNFFDVKPSVKIGSLYELRGLLSLE